MSFLSSVLGVGRDSIGQLFNTTTRLDDNGETVNVNQLFLFSVIFWRDIIALLSTLRSGALEPPGGTLPPDISALDTANVDHLAVCFRQFDQLSEFGMLVNPIVNGLP